MQSANGIKDMVYVAADPKQPGAAWAICVASIEGDAKWPKEVAKSIADWVRKGATVMHVTRDVGIEMVGKWERPQKAVKTAPAADLFA